MSARRPSPIAVALLAAACVALVAPAAAAQHDTHVSAHAHDDSLSFIVPRQGNGLATLRTRDRKAALVLNDSTVVLQLTDEGRDHLFDGDTASHGLGEAMMVRMLKAGLSEMFDHGIAYRLSGLRRAYASGQRLMLEDQQGRLIFDDTEVNGHHPLRELVPGEAEWFAARVQRAIDARQGRR